MAGFSAELEKHMMIPQRCLADGAATAKGRSALLAPVEGSAHGLTPRQRKYRLRRADEPQNVHAGRNISDAAAERHPQRHAQLAERAPLVAMAPEPGALHTLPRH